MRLRLTVNAAGDLRCVALRDAKRKRLYLEAPGASLVCSSQLQEMTTEVNKSARVGFGRISNKSTFGRVAKRTVREAGAICDRHPRKRVSFLTGTLPGSTRDAYGALAAWSGWVVQTIRQWLQDSCNHPIFFGVWEYQKRGALHVHLCVATETDSEARKIRERWKERWIRILDGVMQRSGVDVYQREQGNSWFYQKWLTRTDAQGVEKSVGSYLGKYLSKGSQSNMKQALARPSRWWFCSNGLRESIRNARCCVELRQVSALYARELIHRISSILRVSQERTYTYASPVDPVVSGIICLTNPIHASLLFDSFREALRCLGTFESNPQPDSKVTVFMLARLFSGRYIGP